MLQTVFGAAAQGGFATIPQSSYTYRPVGVNVEVTPRVTYEGEIILELLVENSTVSGSIDVGGQSAPDVRHPQGDDQAAHARRGVEPARRACCARTTAAA